MTSARLRLYAACVRAELVARGTPCAALGADDAAVRAQLGEWVPLLHLQGATRVVSAKTLVIPVTGE
jgi:hypothetical protein